MNVIINPGSGPVAEATEAHAATNITVFGDDLRRAGLDVLACNRMPDDDYGDGRYAFELEMADGGSIEIQMPGLPVERVRFMGEDGQNILDFPRLYIDGSSYVWEFALSVCEPDNEDDDS
ncbi:hypothetical protein [Streptomyces sp. 1222.5]|uniref:hypothetical protein n=1 Tax=Streptomyces sp. 1222.5 TaxID=1881026 RepID=UPI003D763804